MRADSIQESLSSNSSIERDSKNQESKNIPNKTVIRILHEDNKPVGTTPLRTSMMPSTPPQLRLHSEGGLVRGIENSDTDVYKVSMTSNKAMREPSLSITDQQSVRESNNGANERRSDDNTAYRIRDYIDKGT